MSSIVVLLTASLFGAAAASAQTATLATANLLCKIDQFSSRGAKPFKRCDSLKDKTENTVTGLDACKKRALDKGAAARALDQLITRLRRVTSWAYAL